jgi:hypothetical protein
VFVAAGILPSLFQSGSITKLSGDIAIQREDFTFYFPLGWCILISLVLSLLSWFLGK